MPCFTTGKLEIWTTAILNLHLFLKGKLTIKLIVAHLNWVISILFVISKKKYLFKFFYEDETLLNQHKNGNTPESGTDEDAWSDITLLSENDW